MVTNLITGPDSFFQKQALFGRYRIPTAIALITGLAWAFQPVATYYALDPDVRINIMNATAAEWIIHFMIPFGLWIYFWIAFVLLTKFLGGRLRMGRLFKLTGWGLAPIALAGLVRAAGKHVVFQGETLPHEVRRGVMSAELEGYEAMVAEVGADPVLVAATVASCLLLILSGYIWSFSVRYATDLERQEVLTVVTIPTVIYAAYAVGNVAL